MAQPLNESQIKRVEDAVAKAFASIDSAVDALQQTPYASMWGNALPDVARPLKEASETLRELKLELERAKTDAAQGLSAQETSAQQTLETARASEDAAIKALQDKERERASLEEKLKVAKASLEQGDKDRKDLIKRSNALCAENVDNSSKKESLAAEVLRLKGELEHETTRRTTSISSSATEANALGAAQQQWAENLQRFKEALKAQGDAEKALLKERSAHEVVQQQLSDKSTAYSALLGQQKEDHERLTGMLEKETLDHKASKRRGESLSKEVDKLTVSCERELRNKERWYELASEQREAVNAFLKHLQGDSLVNAPSVQEMKILHISCKESSTSRVLPALPPIVVSAGHLPAPWSYLVYASRGVHMDSRFNSVITPAVSFDLPWVFDTLDRVVRAVVSSTEPVPAVVLVVLLQGIAYVQAAMDLASNAVNLTPTPSTLLQALSDSDKVSESRESVVGIVYEQVDRFIREGAQIESWIPLKVFTGERLSSVNSALPEGVVLVHRDTPGTTFMIRNAADKEQLSIIEAQSIHFRGGDYPFIEMRLPSMDGLPEESRRMILMNHEEQAQVAEWVSSLS